jgi:hypothetical protein
MGPPRFLCATKRFGFFLTKQCSGLIYIGRRLFFSGSFFLFLFVCVCFFSKKNTHDELHSVILELGVQAI